MQTDAKSSVPLTHGWKRWIVENKLLDFEGSRIIEILIQNGIAASVASEEVRAVASNADN